MWFSRASRRPVSVFCILLIISNLLSPLASFALTSGPTAPEATSFEPVDTTDMVNLATGDLAYNVPLLEVPGPAGGYPYHYHTMLEFNRMRMPAGWA